jgi:hypothetical protein
LERLLIIGLDEPEYVDLKGRLAIPCVYADMPPRVQITRGQLLVEKPNSCGVFVPVSKVLFHGIFEDDMPLLSALALWGGPCLPSARGMMDARPRLPCLVRALAVTRFGSMLRGYADRGTTVEAATDSVAKWGEWHCGENKERFSETWRCDVPTLIEPFVTGEAVRVHLMGERCWQIRLAGDEWKKSIHGPGAGLMEADSELAADARRLKKHFGLEMLAMDYIVGTDGSKHLLEVNHIPNVTEFPEIREAYLNWAACWAMGGETLAQKA